MNSNYKEGRKPIYEASLKIAIAREYLTSGSGYGTLAAKHGLAIRTVIHFVRWYRKHYSQTNVEQKIVTDVCFQPSENNLQLLDELKEANLKITALEMLIETAQKELGIDIIKKSGTKQSSK